MEKHKIHFWFKYILLRLLSYLTTSKNEREFCKIVVSFYYYVNGVFFGKFNDRYNIKHICEDLQEHLEKNNTDKINSDELSLTDHGLGESTAIFGIFIMEMNCVSKYFEENRLYLLFNNSKKTHYPKPSTTFIKSFRYNELLWRVFYYFKNCSIICDTDLITSPLTYSRNPKLTKAKIEFIAGDLINLTFNNCLSVFPYTCSAEIMYLSGYDYAQSIVLKLCEFVVNKNIFKNKEQGK